MAFDSSNIKPIVNQIFGQTFTETQHVKWVGNHYQFSILESILLLSSGTGVLTIKQIQINGGHRTDITKQHRSQHHY